MSCKAGLRSNPGPSALKASAVLIELTWQTCYVMLCSSIVGLNKMLEMCDKFALHYSIIFNCKKTVCIKFVDKIIAGEKAIFNGTYLEWADSVRHLGNYIDITCTGMIDCKAKRYVFHRIC